ncbi:hypothetical protein IKN40_01165 [bacterium]|nr:hypothetical protein [bacterium]
MNQVKNLEALREEILESEKEFEAMMQRFDEEQRNRPPVFTPSVIAWIVCFLLMVGSLIYKEFYLEQYSDDWRFFSAIHVITALICIGGVVIYILTTQRVFEEDLSEIDKYKECVPILMKDNRIYANSRALYEQILDHFKEYIQLAKNLYFFGIIGMATIFFIWDITQYFLGPNAYVVSLSSDAGWIETANQIYFPGLFIVGFSVIGSVMIREIIKANAVFFTLVLHIGDKMNQIINDYQLIKSSSE